MIDEPRLQYGLKIVGKERLLGVEIKHNGEDRVACGEYTYQLDEWSEDTWLMEDYNSVVMAKWTSEEWYNSSYDEPVNPYHPLELEIVKIVTITTVKDSDIKDEIEEVNAKLKEQGYNEIDADDYVGK